MQFRPDGLLASASRYPRFPDEPWSKEESARGWYNYHPRLIDCETGLHIETGIALLDKDGKTIASRNYTSAQWLKQVEQALQTSQSHHWPSQSEIFLACAGASSPTLKKRRATLAGKTPPRLTERPLVMDLQEDSKALFALTQMRFELDDLTNKPPASATALFEQLRLQYISWRKSIYQPYVASAGNPAKDAEILRAVNQESRKSGAKLDVLHMLKGSIVEYQREWSLPYGYALPTSAANAAFATEIVRADCSSGIEVPLTRHIRDADWKILSSTRVTSKEALVELKQVYHPDRELVPDLWNHGVVHENRFEALALCRMIKGSAGATVDADADADADAPLPFGLTHESLAQQKTPAALLLLIRAAWRAQSR